jgi:hypothetical protein
MDEVLAGQYMSYLHLFQDSGFPMLMHTIQQLLRGHDAGTFASNVCNFKKEKMLEILSSPYAEWIFHKYRHCKFHQPFIRLLP